MGLCYMCEKEPCEKYFGYWCPKCRELKNIMNVYGKDKVLEIVKFCTLRSDKQINNKEKLILQNDELKTRHVGVKGLDNEANDIKDYDRPRTRNQKKTPPKKI